jgi:hypothetical protein
MVGRTFAHYRVTRVRAWRDERRRPRGGYSPQTPGRSEVPPKRSRYRPQPSASSVRPKSPPRYRSCWFPARAEASRELVELHGRHGSRASNQRVRVWPVDEGWVPDPLLGIRPWQISGRMLVVDANTGQATDLQVGTEVTGNGPRLAVHDSQLFFLRGTTSADIWIARFEQPATSPSTWVESGEGRWLHSVGLVTPRVAEICSELIRHRPRDRRALRCRSAWQRGDPSRAQIPVNGGGPGTLQISTSPRRSSGSRRVRRPVAC